MNKKKLMAYMLASSMFLSGCKANIKGILYNYKDCFTKKDFNTSATDDFSKEKVSEVKDLTVPATLETVPATTEPVKDHVQNTENTQIEESETVLNQTEDNIIVYATTDVNICSSNTSSSLKIGSFKIYDAAYRILCCDNNWDLVKYNNQIGYVCKDYLEYSEDSYETEYKHTKKNDIVITITDLNFRIAPNTDAEIISTFNQNTELQVIAEVDNGWLLVKNNGVLGYVHGEYTMSLLEKAKEQYPELNINELDVKKIIYSTTNLNIRNGNSTDYERISSLDKFESVRVLDEYDDWYFIMTNDYNFGFVSKVYTVGLDNNFVVVDLSEQRLYMYNSDELYYVTPVTTGKDSTPSDIGLFKIYSKKTDTYLTGADYKTFVKYWMPYNGGEGLHDASWRSVFGTESYKTYGSHGCINIPPYIADDIYKNVSVGTKVLVHK